MLRIKPGQSTEEEIFANGQEPGAFDEFLNVLGELPQPKRVLRGEVVRGRKRMRRRRKVCRFNGQEVRV